METVMVLVVVLLMLLCTMPTMMVAVVMMVSISTFFCAHVLIKAAHVLDAEHRGLARVLPTQFKHVADVQTSRLLSKQPPVIHSSPRAHIFDFKPSIFCLANLDMDFGNVVAILRHGQAAPMRPPDADLLGSS
eukprot:2789359-Rhodomonas_salina.2